ncbi:hypothetical protein EV360DRAFT_57600, partial [Lentinula raphanica]
LRAKWNYEAFARDGVSQERLQLFMADPKKHGPKLRNTRLDKTGHDTKQILDTPWNRALIRLLAMEARAVVDNCQDDRFGTRKKKKKIRWPNLIRQRLSRIVLDEIKSRPLDDQETVQQRVQRLAEAYQKRKKRSKGVTIRHAVRHNFILTESC